MDHTASKKGNTSLIYVLIALVIVIGGIVWYSTQKSTIAPTKDDENGKMEASDEKNEEKEEDSKMTKDTTESDVRVVNVKGSPFKFEPSEIKVKKGEKIKIVFTNEKGMHDWVIDEFDARTKQIKAGETDSVEFTADKAGTFEYYCSVSNHKAMGMKGNLIVE